jgi:DNA-directed RNA polymerase specialized sigma24 family protein
MHGPDAVGMCASSELRLTQTLVRQILAGDGSAFERLMRRHNRRLFRLARAALGNDADAEDALQEAYLSAHRSMAQFRSEASLSTWLSRMVLNECYARLRKACDVRTSSQWRQTTIWIRSKATATTLPTALSGGSRCGTD